MISHNDARAQFYAAFAKAQGEIDNASKDSTNPYFNSKYADLASVYAACRKHLSANGIGVIQMPEYNTETGLATVETKLVHSGGHSESGKLSLPVQKKDAQGVGSAITYARRYGLMAAVGIAPEDDDGNAAVKQGSRINVTEGGPNKVKPSNVKKTSARQLRQEEKWEKFTEEVDKQSDALILEKWFESTDIQEALKKWPTAWQEQATEYVNTTLEKLSPLGE